MRNSSLLKPVYWEARCAENVPGLSYVPKSRIRPDSSGRVVEERFQLLRRFTVKWAGALGGENVGMSNRKICESQIRRKPEVSSAMTIIGGLVMS